MSHLYSSFYYVQLAMLLLLQGFPSREQNRSDHFNLFLFSVLGAQLIKESLFATVLESSTTQYNKQTTTLVVSELSVYSSPLHLSFVSSHYCWASTYLVLLLLSQFCLLSLLQLTARTIPTFLDFIPKILMFRFKVVLLDKIIKKKIFFNYIS